MATKEVVTTLAIPDGIDVAEIATSSRVELIETSRLRVDRYQRDASQKRVLEYGTNWDDVQAQALDVNERPDGRLFIMDGQHRWEAAKIAGIPALRCVVHQIDPSLEPVYFVKFQTARRRVSPFERHRALLFAKNDVSVAIQRIADECGIRLCSGKSWMTSPGATEAVAAVYTAYEQHGEDTLAETFKTIRLAWHDDTYALSGGMIAGVTLFITTFPRVPSRELAAKLSGVTPRGLELRGKQMGGRRGLAVEIASLWNKGKRTGKVDPLDIDTAATRAKSAAAVENARLARAAQAAARKWH